MTLHGAREQRFPYPKETPAAAPAPQIAVATILIPLLLMVALEL